MEHEKSCISIYLITESSYPIRMTPNYSFSWQYVMCS